MCTRGFHAGLSALLVLVLMLIPGCGRDRPGPTAVTDGQATAFTSTVALSPADMTINLGQSPTVTAVVHNQGADSDNAVTTVSSPQLDQAADSRRVAGGSSGDLPGHGVHGAGMPIHDSACQAMTADYLLADWECACRATSTAAFCNGAISHARCSPVDPNLILVGWYCGNANLQTHDVMGKSPNAWSLYDMHGSVWEWCWDWYGTYTGPETDPTGPASGWDRVARGGRPKPSRRALPLDDRGCMMTREA